MTGSYPCDHIKYSLDAWKGGAKSLKQEFDYVIDGIEGEIPPDINGTWFQNGPGLFDVNGHPLFHPWDGDGMICSISFSQGKAHFRNRFIETEGFLAEKKADRILYRGLFGTQKPGGVCANIFDLRRKNVANTHIVYWGEKLLALWEASNPYRIDPSNLDTLGIETFDGTLRKGSPFTAHPKILPGTSEDSARMVAFALNVGFRTKIDIYELDVTGKVVKHLTHRLPGFAFIHDFAVTPNYYIFFQSPVSSNFIPYVLGFRGAAQGINLRRDRPTFIWTIPRQSGKQIQKIETDPILAFHHANAYEKGHEIVIDSVLYQSFFSLDRDKDYPENVDFGKLPPGQLYRHYINLNNNIAKSKLVDPQCVEFPRINPNLVGQQHQFIFLGAAQQKVGNAPLQSILKIKPETGQKDYWSAAPRGFLGEPIFIPASIDNEDDSKSLSEDAGWVLNLVYDSTSQRTDAVILNAKHLSSGPIARLHLRHHIPYGLHGNFVPGLT